LIAIAGDLKHPQDGDIVITHANVTRHIAVVLSRFVAEVGLERYLLLFEKVNLLLETLRGGEYSAFFRDDEATRGRSLNDNSIAWFDSGGIEYGLREAHDN
jgi:hypothetical protein